jgi:hypothetical protein
MTERADDFEPGVDEGERRQLVRLSDQLERDRPVPRPSFRGSLRRSLLMPTRGEGATATRFRVWIAGYAAAGGLCLLVTAIGIAGVGPFAA